MGCKGSRRGNAGSVSRVLSALTLAMVLSSATVCPATQLPEPAEIEQTFVAIQACMARAPAPWPEPWRREYLDTIREVINAHRDAYEYTRRLQILREGFGPCWEGLTKNKDRSHFEVRRAQIRWYVENLMEAELPGEEERQTLRHQYEDLAEHAAQSLLAQFPFLDPNVVQRAKADHLAECYRNIDAPLLPIFLSPFSQAQVARLKEQWHDLRYARVDLWRQLGGTQKTSVGDQDAPSVQSHPDYLLTERSLSLWQRQVWASAAPAPDYCRIALAKEIDAQKQRAQAMSRTREQEMRLPFAVQQTEYLSFLLAALLETAEGFHEEQK